MMNSTCRPATSHFFLVKLCYAPPGSWLQCCAHVSQNEDEAPGAGLALGKQEGGHLVPALGHGAVDEGVSRHEVHAGLGELLVEGEQRLLLVRPRVSVCGGPAGDTRHVPHPPVGRVARQTRAPNPVAAVLVQTGQTLLLSF